MVQNALNKGTFFFGGGGMGEVQGGGSVIFNGKSLDMSNVLDLPVSCVLALFLLMVCSFPQASIPR